MGRRVGMYHFGLKIGESDDELACRWSRARARGVELVGCDDHTVTHSLYLQDPDGNELELFIDVPGVDWRGTPRAASSPAPLHRPSASPARAPGRGSRAQRHLPAPLPTTSATTRASPWSVLRWTPTGCCTRRSSTLGGEERPGQIELAVAIDDTIEGGTHLVAEAPTGSGKTLVYLCPVVTSGAKTVVATATIALQDQLLAQRHPVGQAPVRLGPPVPPCSRVVVSTSAGPSSTLRSEVTRLFDVRPHASFGDDIAWV